MKDYDVGYRRPPVKSRFKKGASGNPSGRPKRPKTPAEHAARVLTRKRRLRKDGVPVELIGLEALFESLLALGLKGSVSATKVLIEYAAPALQESEQKQKGTQNKARQVSDIFYILEAPSWAVRKATTMQQERGGSVSLSDCVPKSEWGTKKPRKRKKAIKARLNRTTSKSES